MEEDSTTQQRPRKHHSPDLVRPMYARQSLLGPTPRHSIPEQGMAPSTAYNLIHDELILDGSSRFNLATFWYVYTFYAPLVLVSHLMIFAILVKSRSWKRLPKS